MLALGASHRHGSWQVSSTYSDADRITLAAARTLATLIAIRPAKGSSYTATSAGPTMRRLRQGRTAARTMGVRRRPTSAQRSPHIVPAPADEAGVDPEEAFVASLSPPATCCSSSIIARRDGFVVESYVDEADGVMEKRADGKIASDHASHFARRSRFLGDKLPHAERRSPSSTTARTKTASSPTRSTTEVTIEQ